MGSEQSVVWKGNSLGFVLAGRGGSIWQSLEQILGLESRLSGCLSVSMEKCIFQQIFRDSKGGQLLDCALTGQL